MSNIFRVAFFSSVLVVLLFSVNIIYDLAIPYDITEKVNWILSKKNEEYNFAVLGSSRAYLTVHIPTIEQALNGKGINISLEGTAYPEQYLIFYLFTNQTRITHLLFQIDIFGLDDSTFSYPYHEYLYFPYIYNGNVFDSLLDNCGYRVYAWKYLPFFKYAEYNSQIGLINIMKAVRGLKPVFDESGSLLIEKEWDDSTVKNMKPQVFAISEKRLKYFLQIIELAKKRNIKVTMFMAPEYSAIYKYQTNRKDILRFYNNLATKYNIPFLEFRDKDICEDKANFYNAGHLNKKGALLFSDRLAKTLRTYKK